MENIKNINTSTTTNNLYSQTHNLTYKIDLKEEKYKTNYDKINKIFEGNYLKFIRSINNGNLKEIYVLLRKYQYTLHTIILNNSLIINLRQEDLDMDKIKNLFNKDNIIDINTNTNTNTNEQCLEFYLELIPKFLKNEFQFEIPNDLLDVHIKITFKNNDFSLITNTSLTITNLTSDVFKSKKIPHNFNLYLSNKLFDFIIMNFDNNIIEGLNKFLVRIENYLPQVYLDFEKEYSKKKEWTEEEITKFKEGLKIASNKPKIEEKIDMILNLVKTKSFESCLER